MVWRSLGWMVDVVNGCNFFSSGKCHAKVGHRTVGSYHFFLVLVLVEKGSWLDFWRETMIGAAEKPFRDCCAVAGPCEGASFSLFLVCCLLGRAVGMWSVVGSGTRHCWRTPWSIGLQTSVVIKFILLKNMGRASGPGRLSTSERRRSIWCLYSWE